MASCRVATLRPNPKAAKIANKQSQGRNTTHMEFDDVILGRRSIRGYKPDPVPRALIEEILTLAMQEV